MIDSGAFSAWTQQKKVNLKRYISFCKELQDKARAKEITFVNLDVIPGEFGKEPTSREVRDSAKQGWANFEKMREAGLSAVHIFHQGEEWKWLERLIGYPSIGISPDNGCSWVNRLQWLAQVFDHLKAWGLLGKIKVHGFAVTNWKAMTSFPWYSVDSATWAKVSGMGGTMVWNSKKGRLTTVKYKAKKKMLRYGHVDWIDSSLNLKHVNRLSASAQAYGIAEEYLSRLWTKKGIIWNDIN